MKIRSGFVSNSSSSSFVVPGKDITTSDVALVMLHAIMFDWILDYSDSTDFNKDFVKALWWLYEHPDFDENISFPWSVNENTMITKTDSGVFVETSQNHPWYMFLKVNHQWVENDGRVSSFDLLDCEDSNLPNSAKLSGFSPQAIDMVYMSSVAKNTIVRDFSNEGLIDAYRLLYMLVDQNKPDLSVINKLMIIKRTK